METLTHRYLDTLDPSDHVYEVYEEDDFAIRVFPNGSKTWVYIYQVDQFLRRKTLGIYPEMGVNDARDAVQMARQVTQGVEIEQRQEDSTSPERSDSDDGSWPLGKVAVIVMVAAAGVGGFLMLQNHEEPLKVAGPIESAEMTYQASVTEEPAANSEYREQELFAEVQVEVEREQPQISETPMEIPPVANAELEPAQEGQVVEVPSDIESSETTVAPVETVIEVVADSKQASPIEEPIPKQDDLVEPLKLDDVDTVSEAPAKPTDTTVAQLSDLIIKRAQFTSGIDGREPIDYIDVAMPRWQDGEEFKQLYFFTEVGKMEGRTVYHRWELNGEKQAEISFNVKSDWRWRVYSSKKIMASMIGEWRVSVLDDEGNLLHSQTLLFGSDEVADASL